MMDDRHHRITIAHLEPMTQVSLKQYARIMMTILGAFKGENDTFLLNSEHHFSIHYTTANSATYLKRECVSRLINQLINKSTLSLPAEKNVIC